MCKRVPSRLQGTAKFAEEDSLRFNRYRGLLFLRFLEIEILAREWIYVYENVSRRLSAFLCLRDVTFRANVLSRVFINLHKLSATL